jgi:hypothetical protein
MHPISTIQTYTATALGGIIALVIAISTAVNMLASGIPAKTYALIESDYPRLGNFLRLSRAIGAHFRKAAPALLGVLTGKPWQAGVLEKAVAALEDHEPLPPTNPPQDPASSPAETLEVLLEKLRAATVDHPEGARALPVLEMLLLAKPSPTPPSTAA